MHEDLLGYLLGALEPHEMRRIAQLLRDDPAARDELARIEESLRPLEDDYEPVSRPSSDLVSRTLDALPPLPSASETHSQESTPVNLLPMSEAIESSSRSSGRWLDWVSGSIAIAVLLGLLLPAIAQGRFESRKAACSDQLRQLGTDLIQYVLRNERAQLPAVAGQGPEAFAGVYAVRLRDAGLLDDPTVRWCPSFNPPKSNPGQLVSLNEIVTSNDLRQASSSRLSELQRMIGGHYAYTLGVIEANRLTAPKFESRSTFAVMSDAPISTIGRDGVRSEQLGHSQKGINVLYEDGRVHFYTAEALNAMPDHPLMNHLDRSEAGVTTNDASLGPSWQPPFAKVRMK